MPDLVVESLWAAGLVTEAIFLFILGIVGGVLYANRHRLARLPRFSDEIGIYRIVSSGLMWFLLYLWLVSTEVSVWFYVRSFDANHGARMHFTKAKGIFRSPNPNEPRFFINFFFSNIGRLPTLDSPLDNCIGLLVNPNADANAVAAYLVSRIGKIYPFELPSDGVQFQPGDEDIKFSCPPYPVDFIPESDAIDVIERKRALVVVARSIYRDQSTPSRYLIVSYYCVWFFGGFDTPRICAPSGVYPKLIGELVHEIRQ